jgi:exodeoxyribonuclease VII small subunit
MKDPQEREPGDPNCPQEPACAGGGSFEDELGLLERAVERLEKGDLSLEEAIGEFERGFRSWKRCTEVLQDAQKRIEVLCEEADGSDSPAAAAVAWRPAAAREELGSKGRQDVREDEED